MADVQRGDKVVVIGDGPWVNTRLLAAKISVELLGVLMSRHEERQMALESGATAVVAERGEEDIAKVRGFLAVVQMRLSNCVGTEAY